MNQQDGARRGTAALGVERLHGHCVTRVCRQRCRDAAADQPGGVDGETGRQACGRESGGRHVVRGVDGNLELIGASDNRLRQHHRGENDGMRIIDRQVRRPAGKRAARSVDHTQIHAIIRGLQRIKTQRVGHCPGDGIGILVPLIRKLVACGTLNDARRAASRHMQIFNRCVHHTEFSPAAGGATCGILHHAGVGAGLAQTCGGDRTGMRRGSGDRCSILVPLIRQDRIRGHRRALRCGDRETGRARDSHHRGRRLSHRRDDRGQHGERGAGGIVPSRRAIGIGRNQAIVINLAKAQPGQSLAHRHARIAAAEILDGALGTIAGGQPVFKPGRGRGSPRIGSARQGRRKRRDWRGSSRGH